MKKLLGIVILSLLLSNNLIAGNYSKQTLKYFNKWLLKNGHNQYLEKDSDDPPSLGENEYTGIIVFYYLYRPIIPNIIKALKLGGILIYETFHVDNHHQYNHPRRKEFCLEDNELLHLTSKMHILHYEEGQHQNQAEQHPVFTVRLVAQKV